MNETQASVIQPRFFVPPYFSSRNRLRTSFFFGFLLCERWWLWPQSLPTYHSILRERIPRKNKRLLFRLLCFLSELLKNIVNKRTARRKNHHRGIDFAKYFDLSSELTEKGIFKSVMELSTNYEELVFFQHHEEDGKKLVSCSNYYD